MKRHISFKHFLILAILFHIVFIQYNLFLILLQLLFVFDASNFLKVIINFELIYRAS